jgi:hypothetical protein
MIGNSKIALLAVDTMKGERIIVTHDDCAVPVRESALAAQKSGSVKIDGKDVPIAGGFVVCSWRDPCVTWRFRCDPATTKTKK